VTATGTAQPSSPQRHVRIFSSPGRYAYSCGPVSLSRLGGQRGGLAGRSTLIWPHPVVGGDDTPRWCGTTAPAGRIVGDVGEGSSLLVGPGWGSKRVELFAAIRFDWQRHQMSIRSLARKYDVHRRTVRQAIASPLSPDREVPTRFADAAAVPTARRQMMKGRDVGYLAGVERVRARDGHNAPCRLWMMVLGSPG